MHSPRTPLFEIAIYRCPRTTFESKYDADLQAHCTEIHRRGGTRPETWSREFSLSVRDNFWENYVAPWQYNQIVGWLRLYAFGSQLRAEFWLSDAKRFSRRMKLKRFRLQGDAFQIQAWPEQTSHDLLNSLYEALREFEARHPRLILDLEPLEGIGGLVDWRSIFLPEVSGA